MKHNLQYQCKRKWQKGHVSSFLPRVIISKIILASQIGEISSWSFSLSLFVDMS